MENEKEVKKNIRKDIGKELAHEIKHKVRISYGFIIALAIVSILGFLGIVSKNLFDADIINYIESLWLIVIGFGLMLEVKLKKLASIKEKGLTPTNFTHLITFIIGFVAIISGILSFPAIGVSNPGFNATKGIISIIAIVIIIIQTWIVK